MEYRNQILIGDVRERLRDLPDESVHMVVTSPPYWGLRDYGADGQIGLEPTPEAYVANMVDVFREVWRVLRKDGTLWLNLGDSYYGSWQNYSGGDRGAGKQGLITKGSSAQNPVWEGLEDYRPAGTRPHELLKPKDLVGIPWRVAFALQADGWWLRSDIIWSKPNPMPESVTDRPTKSHEYVFLFAKSERYFYDAQAIREPLADASLLRISQPTFDRQTGGPKDYGPDSNRSARRSLENFASSNKQNAIADAAIGSSRRRLLDFNDRWDEAEDAGIVQGGRNRRTVWEITTKPYADAHFATFPPDLVQPCILAGTSEHGVCSSCGAPWRRVVAKTESPHDAETASAYEEGSNANRVSLARQAARANGAEYAQETVTLGWQPTCDHEAAIDRAVVLDPFMGSGTTARVALLAGRDFVGVELNPEYVALAEKRMHGDNGQDLRNRLL